MSRTLGEHGDESTAGFAKALGWRIRRARRSTGASRDVIAARTGLHKNSIANIELGKSVPTVETLVLIAQALSVEPALLIDTRQERTRGQRRSTEEIEAMIARIEADDRYNSPPANVAINAPLALIQVELKATADALRWMLGEPHHLDPGPKKSR